MYPVCEYTLALLRASGRSLQGEVEADIAMTSRIIILLLERILCPSRCDTGDKRTPPAAAERTNPRPFSVVLRFTDVKSVCPTECVLLSIANSYSNRIQGRTVLI